VPPREALARVRFCRSASAALPPEHLRAFEATFGIGIIETMGLTETVAPCFSNPIDPAQRKVGSVGRASGCEARAVDAEGSRCPTARSARSPCAARR
jgi:long-chain acyl-CoA synthetase